MPPPVDGQTLIAATVLQCLRDRGVRCFVVDTSKPVEAHWKSTLERLGRLASAGIVIAAGRWRGAHRIYIGALANKGLSHSALCALLARLLGYAVTIRHDSSSYSRKRALKMQLLAACAGESALHVTLAGSMSEDLRARYAGVGNTLTLGNAFVVEHASVVTNDCSQELRLGHLSNLSGEKGLVRALDVLRQLLRAGISARLTLAGPAYAEEDRAIIAQALAEFGKHLAYKGCIMGEEKARFYRALDVFLFPSLYRNEAQPIVCLEAMAAGVPVIAYDWAYLGDMLFGGGGYVVDPTRDFAEQALAILNRWVVEPQELRAASTQAQRRFLKLRQDANEALGRLLTVLAG